MSTITPLGLTVLDAGVTQPQVVINANFQLVGDFVGNPPRARVYHNADQSIANDSYVAVALNSERFDTDVIHDTSTNNSRLTCKTAGLYLISGVLIYAFNATGYREASIRLGGSTFLASTRMPAVSTNSAETSVAISTVYPLAVNDYVELISRQTSGGSLNVKTFANFSPEFMMVRIGA